VGACHSRRAEVDADGSRFACHPCSGSRRRPTHRTCHTSSVLCGPRLEMHARDPAARTDPPPHRSLIALRQLAMATRFWSELSAARSCRRSPSEQLLTTISAPRLAVSQRMMKSSAAVRTRAHAAYQAVTLIIIPLLSRKARPTRSRRAPRRAPRRPRSPPHRPLRARVGRRSVAESEARLLKSRRCVHARVLRLEEALSMLQLTTATSATTPACRSTPACRCRGL
jgi:hypothetical protein